MRSPILELDDDDDDDDDDLHDLVVDPFSVECAPNDDIHQRMTSTPATTKTTTTTPPKGYNNRSSTTTLLERILSTPIVAFFTCGGVMQAHAIQNGASIAMVVQTMKQFPRHVRVQRMGCGSLKDMTLDSWSNKEKVVEVGGVEALLRAMRLHAKDVDVQKHACSCLYNLVAGKFPALLMERGVVAAVLTTIDNHSQDEDVLPEACNCLLALTDRGTDDALDLIRQKLGGVVLAKIENYFRGRNGEIRQKAGELLRRLYTS